MNVVRKGLLSKPKKLPPALFYDEYGSKLYREITRLPEYYPTRTEASILRDHAPQIAPPDVSHFIELGSGSSEKTRILLDAFTAGGREMHYVAIDISKEVLLQSSRSLLEAYPSLRVTAVAAEYAEGIRKVDLAEALLIAFLGSSIGNFDADGETAFLRSLRPANCPLLLGFDMRKDPTVLEAAYNDSRGVTAAFNLNMLRRINHELDGGFVLHHFEHRAIWNAADSRIEMHIHSRGPQTVSVADFEVHFEKDESIHTENSHKFTPESIAALAERSGFRVEKTWTDPKQWFSVVRFRPA